jgi:hypothetical protein
MLYRELQLVKDVRSALTLGYIIINKSLGVICNKCSRFIGERDLTPLE